MKKFLLSTAFIATSFLAVAPLQAAEYEVEQGDSLWKIAEDHNTSVAKLREMNSLESNIIIPKQILNIEREITYIVKKGDSLSEIAKEHDVLINDIKEWNNLETNLILIGEELTIKESAENNEDSDQDSDQEKAEQEAKVTVASTPEATDPAEVKTTEVKKQEKTSNQEKSGKTINVTATAYTAKCAGCSGITATGINLLENPNMKVIAVDPNVIPLGSRVYVEGYGEAIAGDTGGAINGNKVDLHVPTKQEALNWGRRQVQVTILN
ncbi:LysM peptidoglycan-binding domain-containing protein [Gracilibacillus oryzae]|uniref:LysM peptidoglycan-binding domain-containing protein n=1 Tax=Gracilibacillus oryzae TaxID=1672701 RepID=A0A7C8KSK7_9BACI|nr:LysM peptidoglycan-binding domain-containing protein [Gracilibacillus oryzae]KAB8137674.1 LysM peptidoglycan-binding domain-containing protein [Gracilibacillus oryzae]